MGVLGDLFNGPNGVEKWFHQTMGGDAVITHVGKRVFDELRERWIVVEDDAYTHTTFLPLPRSRMIENTGRASLEDDVTIGGSVPACDITRPIVPDQDKLTYGGETYTIVRVDDDGIDNTTGHYLIYGVR